MKSNRKRGDWQRVSKSRPCPICDHHDWCLVTGPESDPTAAICQRVESDKRAGDAGYLHRLRDDHFRPTHRAVKISTAPPAKIGTTDFAAMAGGCSLSLGDDHRESLAAHLGVSADSLVRLCVGWSGQNDAFTFPMRDAGNNFVGIRLRGRDGRKWSVKGGREGLFVPHDLGGVDQLLVCEGPTDTAALMDLGFTAVGRPSCTGGARVLLDLVRSNNWEEVVIVADDDPPGWSGAQRLAHKLLPEMGKVKIVTPPAGVKDAREWKRQGATRDDMLAAIDAALSLELRVAQGVAL